jgi:hypothetical protein
MHHIRSLADNSSDVVHLMLMKAQKLTDLICRNVNGLFGLKSGYSVVHNSLKNADCQ